jgi:hypothetical protein
LQHFFSPDEAHLAIVDFGSVDAPRASVSMHASSAAVKHRRA